MWFTWAHLFCKGEKGSSCLFAVFRVVDQAELWRAETFRTVFLSDLNEFSSVGLLLCTFSLILPWSLFTVPCGMVELWLNPRGDLSRLWGFFFFFFLWQLLYILKRSSRVSSKIILFSLCFGAASTKNKNKKTAGEKSPKHRSSCYLLCPKLWAQRRAHNVANVDFGFLKIFIPHYAEI